MLWVRDGWCGGVVCQLHSGREHLVSNFLHIYVRTRTGAREGVVCVWSLCVHFLCVCSSFEGRTVDAWAQEADEGRGSLR